MVGHQRAVHPSYGTYKFMGHGAHRGKVVFHSQIHVACAREATCPRHASLTFGHGAYGCVLRFERGTTTCAEIAEHASGINHAAGLAVGAVVIISVVKLLFLAGDDIIQLGDYGKHLDLK